MLLDVKNFMYGPCQDPGGIVCERPDESSPLAGADCFRMSETVAG